MTLHFPQDMGNSALRRTRTGANYMGAAAKVGFDDALRIYVDLYNSLPFVEKEKADNTDPVRIEYGADKLDELVDGTKVISDAYNAELFSFATEEEAQEVVLKCMKCCVDFVSIRDIVVYSGANLVIPDSALFGWSKEAFAKCEIGKTLNGYVLFVPMDTYGFIGKISNEEL